MSRRRCTPRPLAAVAAAAVGLALALAAPSAPAEGPEPLSPGEVRVLQQVCGTCHARPGIGVPLLGDEQAWAPRRSQGLEAMLANTVNGLGGMPPLGTCSWCSEDALRRIIAVMSGMGLEGR